MKYVALLRGINVGGRAKLPMADLRALLISLGHGDVTTYIQSGNAVFTPNHPDREAVRAEIEERMRQDMGMEVAVMVRTPRELEAAMGANPFVEAVTRPTTLHIGFLSAQPPEDSLAELDLARFAPDEVRLGDQVLYLHYPNGAGQTRLTTDVLERRLGVRMTARNWNTVTRLLSMARD